MVVLAFSTESGSSSHLIATDADLKAPDDDSFYSQLSPAWWSLSLITSSVQWIAFDMTCEKVQSRRTPPRVSFWAGMIPVQSGRRPSVLFLSSKQSEAFTKASTAHRQIRGLRCGNGCPTASNPSWSLSFEVQCLSFSGAPLAIETATPCPVRPRQARQARPPFLSPAMLRCCRPRRGPANVARQAHTCPQPPTDGHPSFPV
ncbi:hypothetical protein B0T20DRAFT_406086 [Sordaria brevicollis]|uniref:Uncharacterized protein n=1 Tax=Sordaria brevicollis TaxID=83679 RepID=A0AAE0PJU4_SORBR|nr:hypothetical protein B0T20DRAFT_406086 [Sordaria brevicollis]